MRLDSERNLISFNSFTYLSVLINDFGIDKGYYGKIYSRSIDINVFIFK